MTDDIDTIDIGEIGDDFVYSEKGREILMDEEEITPEEDAFMEGYEKAYD